MTGLGKKLALAAGALALFAVAFTGFLLASGTAPEDLPLVGGVLGAAEEPAQDPDDAEPPPSRSELPPDVARRTPRDELLAGNIGVLGGFLMPAPYSASELTKLADEVKQKRVQLDRGLAELRRRERELDDRERGLEERYRQLLDLRSLLESAELEQELRSEELERDADATRERERQSWASLARFFEEGDPEELADKLVVFEPEDAALVLRALPTERASQLVNALPDDKFKAYVEAYRKLE